MTPAPGSRLDHYEISEIIGKGGMGEVYRATDTRLPRDVAIKTSKQQFSERFARETKVIASLNHPNICTLFDVGPNYLVMEMIEGPTLAERIKQGPMSLDETATIMKQVADALDYAHEKGVVHRDLKPGNIKIRPDGLVKVLDFGLAKVGPTAAASSAAAADADNSPTMTLGGTQAGVVLGTAAYMSPEQAMGKVVDKRADVWAFGTVLYEMLTGARMHTGDTVQEILASVLKDEPDLTRIPAQAHRLIKRCLEKDPNKRLKHVGDVMALLDDAPSFSGSGPISGSQPAIAPLPPEPVKKNWLWPAISAASVALALGVAGWALWLKPAPPAKVTRFQVPLPDKSEFGQYLSLSPDGHKLIFNTTGPEGGLWVRDLDSLEAHLLPGTQGVARMFWSPDSKFVAFGQGNQLKKMDIAGGPAQTLCEISSTVGSGAWSRDGVILFGAVPGPLRRVSEAGGVPVDLTISTGVRTLPSFLPDGKHFLYNVAGDGLYSGSIDAKPEAQPQKRILANQYAALYATAPNSSSGHLFLLREGTLLAQPFDANKLELTGEPVPVAEHVGTGTSHGFFSISPGGALAYRTGASAASRQLTWLDRQGKATGTFGEPNADVGVALSADGTRAAVRDIQDQGPGDLWTLDFKRGVRTRFTFRQNLGSYGVWSPDGSRIIFSAGTLFDTIYEKAASGAGEEKELLKKPGEVKHPTSWSRDGRFLLYYTAAAPKTGSDLWVLPLEGDRKPVLLLGTEFNEFYGSFSPDMRWIAYLSNESGQFQIYVRPFNASGPGSSEPKLGEGNWQVSKDGAALAVPRWRADGKELIFRSTAGLMAVDVNTNGGAFQAGIPKQLFALPQVTPDWDMTADGQKFIVPVPPQSGTAQTPITVVLNWQAALKK